MVTLVKIAELRLSVAGSESRFQCVVGRLIVTRRAANRVDLGRLLLASNFEVVGLVGVGTLIHYGHMNRTDVSILDAVRDPL